MDIVVYRKVSELAALGDAWDRLSGRERKILPSFSELQQTLDEPGVDFRVLAATEQGEVTGIACFVYGRVKKRYAIAERNLFVLPVRQLGLLGSGVFGPIDEQGIARLFGAILREPGYDLINLGEIVVDSPLYNAVRGLGGGALVSRVLRTNSIRWLIDLPDSFEEYCKSLGAQTRKKDVGKFKKIVQRPDFKVEVITRPEQVDKFLLEGEKVSRLTYQWNFGQKLLHDEPTRQHFERLARSGKLRCYMLYLDGQPCAFARGILSRQMYLWETSGYDPQHIKDSPGTALMLWMIRDLIE